MMLYRSTPTTDRLERFALTHFGIAVGVVRSDSNAKGRYFIASRDSKPLRIWMSLGWTGSHAQEALSRLTADE
jgi:hypothetical protein